MKRTMLFLNVIALALFATIAMPQPTLAATSCTDNYMKCINDASQYSDGIRDLAEGECGVEYVGCLAKKLKFW